MSFGDFGGLTAVKPMLAVLVRELRTLTASGRIAIKKLLPMGAIHPSDNNRFMN